jgi:hypothetical protein
VVAGKTMRKRKEARWRGTARIRTNERVNEAIGNKGYWRNEEQGKGEEEEMTSSELQTRRK